MSKLDDIISKCDGWDESKHPRDEDGKFGEGGMKSGKESSLPKGIQAHLEKQNDPDLEVVEYKGMYAWRKKGKPHGRWYGGGEFLGSKPPASGKEAIKWDNDVARHLNGQARLKADLAYMKLGRVWDNPNDRFEDDVYMQATENSDDVQLNFSGRVYDAFTPRRDEEDDDHPNPNSNYKKAADKIESTLREVYGKDVKIRISPQEKYYISADVTLNRSVLKSQAERDKDEGERALSKHYRENM